MRIAFGLPNSLGFRVCPTQYKRDELFLLIAWFHHDPSKEQKNRCQPRLGSHTIPHAPISAALDYSLLSKLTFYLNS
jgi:hypothetical protein